MDKQTLLSYSKAYLLSLFAFFFISPFISLILPPFLALFTPFVLQLITFYFLGGKQFFKPSRDDKLIFIIILSLSFIILSLDSFCFSTYTYRGFDIKVLLFLLFIPLQTLSEEIIFRQFPLQLTKATSNKWIKGIILLLSASVFALMHIANPEASDKLYLAYYFLWGLFAILLTFYTKSISATFAFHTANNLFISIIMNYPSSALPLHSLFIKDRIVSVKHAVTFTIIAYFIIYITIIFLKKGLLCQDGKKQAKRRKNSSQN